MKTFQNFLVLSLCLIFMFGTSFAQEKKKSQAFVVHEDQVHPYMISEYEQAAKVLTDNLKKYNVQDADYLAVSTADFKYMYVSKIDNMAALDKNVFKSMEEKMGKAATDKMWADFDKCYDKHGDYIVWLDYELSNMPEGSDISTPEEPYRVLDYWYVHPENTKKLADVAKAFKALHISKGTNYHYRVYRSGFGTMGPFFMVATSAKNKADFVKKSAEANKLLGEERGKLIQQALKLCAEYETTEAWTRPNLGYQAKAETAVKKPKVKID